MHFKQILSFLWHTSLLKTIKFNIHYFGLSLKPYAFIAHGVQFKNLKGKIILDNKQIGKIRIGYPALGTENDSVYKGTINVLGKVVIHSNMTLCRGASLDCSERGVIDIGSVMITGDTKIICNNRVQIGDECLISWGGT